MTDIYAADRDATPARRPPSREQQQVSAEYARGRANWRRGWQRTRGNLDGADAAFDAYWARRNPRAPQGTIVPQGGDIYAADEDAVDRRSISERRARPGNVVDDAALSFRSGAVQAVVSAANVLRGLPGGGGSGDLQALGGYVVRQAARGRGLITPEQDRAWEERNTAARRGLGLFTSSEELATPAWQSAGAGYRPQTPVGQGFRMLGQNGLNALAPGSAGLQTMNVLAPTAGGIAGRGAGQVIGGDAGGDAGEVAGSILGGLATGVRRAPEPTATGPLTPAVRAVPRNRRQVQAMRQRQAEYEAAGAAPAASDLMTTGGRRRVRAIALRGEDAQQAAADQAAGRRASLGDRASAQARRVVSSDDRTPNQIRTDLTERRRLQGDEQYGAVRNDTFTMDEPTVAALRTDAGRQAIRDAARLETDPTTRAALNRLADDVLDNPNTPVTVGMMDAISQQLLGDSRASQNTRVSSVLGNFGNAVRNNARAAVPAYGNAVDNYAAESRLIDASKLGETFLNRNTDEFAAGMAGMAPDERAMAQASARRAIERGTGERSGSAMGNMESIALTREGHARNVALLGEEGAAELERGMAAERQLNINANEVDPRAGSQTQPNQLAQGVQIGQEVASAVNGRPVGLLVRIGAFLVNRGFSEDDAAAAVRALTDPNQTEAVLQAIEGMGGQPVRLQVQQLLLPAAVGAQSGNGQ